MTITLLLIIFIACPLASTGAKWTYNGPDGEHDWSSKYPFCGGAFQSPIDFQTQLLRYDPNLPPIQVQNYNLSTNEQLTLGNNGHSVLLSLPSHMHISSLPHRYSAAQLHFHWGSSSLLTGSEHTVNGNRFAGEMHVVHFNSDKYLNISMAVDKHDGLAVLGVFIEIGEFNPAFDKFFKYINGIKYRDQKIQVPAFNVRALLPARLDEYYRYDGSLTTPPCYPSVLWTVFRKPVTISRKQFLALATALYASYAQDSATVPLHGNYRKPQLTDNRVVLVSFKDGDFTWMSWGILATIIVASMLGLLLIITLVWCLLRKRSNTEEQKDKTTAYKLAEKEGNISKV
ncbi:carbonic anhydrase 12 isoform X3 [Rhinichthys klamathensis goyatoka]|uniref:carbonic anhydrase 12 isoform X3 n=1 Tax=Rhinichthys klamathensis goyatoka TaxID=3034132 RepID=UPI0024B4D3DC|nr:carbonic anhydrase 12 isoform X3 [Rhinichthys klamathensis goyatoka]